MAYIYELTKRSILKWIDDDCPRMGAALSYYLVFSIAPLILISVSIGGLVFEKSAVQAEIIGQLGGLIGERGIGAVEVLLKSSSRPAAGIVSTALGTLALLIGASAVVMELQVAINKIWRIEEKPLGWRGVVEKRLLSMGMVLGTGFLLLVSLIVSAVLAAAGKFMGMSAAVPPFSLLVITGLFAFIYKALPSTRIPWKSVWPGAVVTSVLFNAGKFLIGFYLGRTGVTSSYGAAGSFIVFIAWVYYSAQIFYLGAEFTKTLADRSTSPLPIEGGTGL